MVKNKHLVDGIAWNRWGSLGQTVFNTLYVDILRYQIGYIHPMTDLVPHEQWKTTAWNLAWVAAETASTVNHDIQSGTFNRDPNYSTEHGVNLYSFG